MKKFIILTFVTFLVAITYADIGPKPTVDINVKYNGQNVPDNEFSAVLLHCVYLLRYEPIINELRELNETARLYDYCMGRTDEFGIDSRDCSIITGIIEEEKYSKCDPNDIECEKLRSLRVLDSENGGCYWTYSSFSWGGDCKNSKCGFGYSIPEKFRLAVYIPSLDEVFVSNKIIRKDFRSSYDANLLSDGTMEMKETTSLSNQQSVRGFVVALIITLFIEVIIAAIYSALKKVGSINGKKLTLTVIIANLISLPMIWFIFPLIIQNIFYAIIAAEIFVIIFEAFLINKLYDKMSLKSSFILSLIMNIASFFAGGYIYLILFMIGLI